MIPHIAGAGHGISAVLQMLLCFPSYLKSNPDAEHDVHVSVDYLMSLMAANSNIPTSLGEASRGEDELVHWCHGAAGKQNHTVRWDADIDGRG